MNCFSIRMVGMLFAVGMIVSSTQTMAETPRPEAPVVQEFVDGFLFEAPSDELLVTMNVRVYDSQGKQILNRRSSGEPVEFLVDHLPDGHYRYEQVIVIGNHDHRTDTFGQLKRERVLRNFDDFILRDGVIVDRSGQQRPTAGQLDSTIQAFGELAFSITSALIKPAIAQTGSNIEVESGIPTITYDDTDNGDGHEWETYTNAFLSGGGFWGVWDNLNNNRVIYLGSSSFNSNSFVVDDQSGDIKLADDAVSIDRSHSRMGIGSTAPSASLHISDAKPDILLFDETENVQCQIVNRFGRLDIDAENPSEGDFRQPFSIKANAETGSLELKDRNVSILSGILEIDKGPSDAFPETVKVNGDFWISDPENDIPGVFLNRFGGAWRLNADESGFFMRSDQNDGTGLSTTPFKILNQAPDNSLVVRDSGNIGLGTESPESNLHVSGGNPAIRLENTNLSSQTFEMLNAAGSFYLNRYNGDDQVSPLIISSAAPHLAITAGGTRVSMGDLIHARYDGSGVGIGTTSPGATLHLQRSNPGIRFENTATGNNVMDLEFSNNFLRIKGAEGQDLGKINAAAPVGTFTTDANGRTGYGTANPAASFNVKYRSAHGSVPIFLAQAPNNDEIFRIQLNGDTFLRGALIHSSDRNAKTAIQPINNAEILQKVTELPISQWQYKASEGINHLGPMAQDFKAAFNLGDTDTGIATVDLDGVALASIQALAERDREISMENKRLRDENLQLKQAHRELLKAFHADRERMATLEAVVTELVEESSEPLYTGIR